jgi:hypothetical protein
MGRAAQLLAGRRRPKYNAAGRYAMQMNGSGQYASTPVHGLFNLNQEEWTCECWLYATAFTNNTSRIIVFTATRSIGLISSGTGFILNVFGGSNVITAGASNSQVLNAWRHYVLMKKGGVTYLFVQGVMIGSSATSWWDNQNTQIGFGGNLAPNAGSGTPGKMSNARFLAYAAYDIAGFPVPKKPPIASLRTELLAFNDSTIKDNSKNAMTMVVTGAPTMVVDSPYPA